MPTEKRIVLFLIASILLLYLIKIPPFYDEYTIGRFIFWTLLSAAGLWYLVPRTKTVTLEALDLTLLAFYLLNLLSISWSKNFGEAIFTTQKYLLLLIFYFLFRQILANKPRYWADLAKILLALSIFVVVLTIYQFIQTYLEEGLAGKSVYKVVSFSGHKNLAASYLFLLLCLNSYFALSAKRKLIYYILIGSQLLLLVLLRSRAVYLATVAFGLIGLSYYLLSNAQLRKLALGRILPIGLAAIMIGILLVSNTPLGKNYQKYLNPSTYLRSASGTERLFVWYKTLDLVKERPLKGFGSGNWKVFFPSKNIEGGVRLQEKDLVFTRVHNDFIEVLAEVGIFGLLLFIATFGWAMGAVIHRMKNGDLQSQKEGIVLIATIVGYLIISFFDFPKERPEHQVLLALLLAMCTANSLSYFQVKGPTLTLSSTQQNTWAIVLSIFLLVNIPISYYRTIGNICTEQVLIGMITKNAPLMREQAQKGHSIWYDVNPMVLPFKWYEGLAYYFEGNYQAARGPFAEAYEINPYNFNVANNYASTLVQLAEYEKAIELYKKALSINPKFEEGMFNMAFSYFQLQAYEQAIDLVNQTSGNPEKKAVFLQEIQEAMAQNPK